MQLKEARALRELYIEVATARAVGEVDQLFTSTDAELDADRKLEEEIRAEAHACYQRVRNLLATTEEFENLVWPSIKADLMREVKALIAMVK
ncbi:MAG TPA: hypothetical protein VF131_11030 [Blastocatellia bacterium]|nr:hypothetical protein [Blastocatellia bacterium]